MSIFASTYTIKSRIKSWERWRTGGVVLLVLSFGLLLAQGAAAHAHLQRATPAQESDVRRPIDQVTLTFSEPVEVLFSTFKVYALEPKEDVLATKAAASQLVSQVLTVRNDTRDPRRVDKGFSPARGISSEVTIGLKDELDPGVYVVMWRVLSIDTHTTSGFYIFTYAPE